MVPARPFAPSPQFVYGGKIQRPGSDDGEDDKWCHRRTLKSTTYLTEITCGIRANARQSKQGGCDTPSKDVSETSICITSCVDKSSFSCKKGSPNELDALVEDLADMSRLQQ